MPTCPGCDQFVPHDRLTVHERYCRDIWGDDAHDAVTLERLDRRLAALERRLDRRVRELEAGLERDASEAESTGPRRSARR